MKLPISQSRLFAAIEGLSVSFLVIVGFLNFWYSSGIVLFQSALRATADSRPTDNC
jgi:hypothetical protein